MNQQQAERAARKIGLWTDNGLWVDARAGNLTGIDAQMLPEYLAAGDRPLRLAEAYRMASDPVVGPGDVLEAWYVSAWSPRHSNIRGAYGPTLEDAILVLVAKIEGGTP